MNENPHNLSKAPHWEFFDHTLRKIVWYDGMPVITMATDLPPKIDGKRQPIHRDLETDK